MITASERMLQRLRERCPSLDEGSLDVLATLGRDLTPHEWAKRLGAKRVDVWRALRILGELR